MRILDFRGNATDKCTAAIRDVLEKRHLGDEGKKLTETVMGILEDVRRNGDGAVCDYTLKLDKVDISNNFRFSQQEIDSAYESVDKELIEVMTKACGNIRAFHEHELEKSWTIKDNTRSSFGIRVTPIDRAGVYVPGGSAPLPSSVLMNIIPAKVAGVKKVIMCTPPGKDGKGNNAILAAAKIAGADEVYRVGGAQAIAAMAYGTETIGRVDKITGPGNKYVACAKRLVFGQCDIDMIAGPSEILIVADKSAKSKYIAADLLSQAEHDPNAASILITDSMTLLESVRKNIDKLLPPLNREGIARASLDNNCLLITVDSISIAIDVANEIAPEHLELCVKDSMKYSELVKNAGAIFCGNYSPEAMGDYYCGSNHILPTGGTARFSSPLGVWDFLKRTSIIHYSRSGFERDRDNTEMFANAEGLGAHALSVSIRKKDKVKDEK